MKVPKDTAKQLRLRVYNKYDGHCAYCGNKVEYKAFQVDHLIPDKHKIRHAVIKDGEVIYPTESFENLMPSCKICNHYKRAMSLENYRDRIQTLIKRIESHYINRVAKAYGIITPIQAFTGKFFFETVTPGKCDECRLPCNIRHHIEWGNKNVCLTCYENYGNDELN